MCVWCRMNPLKDWAAMQINITSKTWASSENFLVAADGSRVRLHTCFASMRSCWAGSLVRGAAGGSWSSRSQPTRRKHPNGWISDRQGPRAQTLESLLFLLCFSMFATAIWLWYLHGVNGCGALLPVMRCAYLMETFWHFYLWMILKVISYYSVLPHRQ